MAAGSRPTREATRVANPYAEARHVRGKREVMSSADSLITEIKEVLDSVSPSRQAAILHDMTDLFLDGAARYSREQIAVFDDVFVTLTEYADRDVLVEFAQRLVSCTHVPSTLRHKLASHPDLKISAIFLKNCVALTDEDIATVAATASYNHLLVIAGRDGIGESVTDALIDRGDAGAIRKFVANQQARVSHVGFVKLINAAKRDGSLGELIASRADLPDELKPFIGMLLSSSNSAQAGATAAAQ